jgi:hypothetical protein
VFLGKPVTVLAENVNAGFPGSISVWQNVRSSFEA